MTEAEVIDRINSTIKKNGNRTITGDEMNFILKAIIELIVDAGGSKPLDSVLADGNETLEYDIILTELDRIVVGANRAGLSKGTFNTGRGGDKGVSLQCAVEFELNWQAGYLRVITPGGDGTPLLLQTDSEIVYTEFVPTTPTYGTSLVTKDYADTKFPNPTGTTAEYIRGDGSIEAFPTIPTTVTNTSDLVNDGEDGVNPFITALDIPMAGQAGTLVREVKNMTGATLTKGTVVYISGANGNKPIVSKALAVSDALSSRTFGLLQSNILNNGVGFCVVIGDLSGLDTSAFTEGAQLYLSGTAAGTFTETKTLAPTHLVYVGKVTRSHPTQGQIEVQIQNGYELNEIHDVAISSVANNQTLIYESASTLWKNKALTTAEVADSTNKRYVTDANLTVIGNTSNTNTGDETQSTILSKLGFFQSNRIVESTAVTGTLLETIIDNTTIPANTYLSGGIMRVYNSKFRKVGANGLFTVKIYIGPTANNLTGATLIGTFATTGAAPLYIEGLRTFTCTTSGILGFNATTSSNTDTAGQTSSARLSATIDWTVAQNIMFTVTLASASDSVTMIGNSIKNF
jgi:hypothetical protein